MINDDICSPALLYVGFSLIHVIIDMYNQQYNLAFTKFLVMILFTIILNLLCQRGLSIISWVVVFIPFIFMTVITTLLLFVFGLNPKSGKLNIQTSSQNKLGNVLPKRLAPSAEGTIDDAAIADEADAIAAAANITDTGSTAGQFIK